MCKPRCLVEPGWGTKSIVSRGSDQHGLFHCQDRCSCQGLVGLAWPADSAAGPSNEAHFFVKKRKGAGSHPQRATPEFSSVHSILLNTVDPEGLMISMNWLTKSLLPAHERTARAVEIRSRAGKAAVQRATSFWQRDSTGASGPRTVERQVVEHPRDRRLEEPRPVALDNDNVRLGRVGGLLRVRHRAAALSAWAPGSALTGQPAAPGVRPMRLGLPQ